MVLLLVAKLPTGVDTRFLGVTVDAEDPTEDVEDGLKLDLLLLVPVGIVIFFLVVVVLGDNLDVGVLTGDLLADREEETDLMDLTDDDELDLLSPALAGEAVPLLTFLIAGAFTGD